MSLYKVVVIKSEVTGKKHKVQVEFNPNKPLAKKLAILDAIDQIVDELVKGRVTPFLYAAGQIFEDSRNYEDFIDKLEDELKIKVEIAK